MAFTSLPPPPPRRTMAAGHAILVVLIALGIGTVLNAPGLAAAAARQPFGWQRSVAVTVLTPIRTFSDLAGLNWPHVALADIAAEANGSASPDDPASAPSPADGAVRPTAPVTGGKTEPAPRRSPPGNDRRGGSREDPLRMWVGGDSLTSEFGPALVDVAVRTRRVAAEVDFRFSTGLARPDFFDWPAQLRRVAATADPDVFVVMFGANDGQNLQVDDRVLTFGTPAWHAEYHRRVTALMQRLSARGRWVWWVGQPGMRSADFDARMSLLNDVYRSAAADHQRVAYVDSRALFTGPTGAFSPYLDDARGNRTLMRQQDGIHLTRAGGQRLAGTVFAEIDARWALTEGD
ncbi:MAG: DUF459 domain-containing protein [Euzebyaceae bacterium]|jgi:hypothetical protein|nr:DUF459 domain-containing protein [Euzebyaceae bacterium]